MAVMASLFLAPSLSDVASGGNEIFLSSNSESQRASALFKQYFGGDEDSDVSTLTVIFFNENQLNADDMSKAQELQAWLLSEQAPKAVLGVQSIFSNPALAGRLISPDGTTMLLNVQLDSSSLESLNRALTEVRAYRDSNLNSSSLQVFTSGMVAIDFDMHKTLTESIHVTTVVTVVLVIVLLLLIYRSPVAILVPLLTISCAYIVSRAALGILGQFVNVWSQLDVLVIVLVFGVGTDYCLFMISRFREELRKTPQAWDALKNMLRRIGMVISASALAVFAGLAVMGVAQFQMLKTAGPSMSISILITLLAALTLTPAVMTYFKRHLFWPTKIKTPTENLSHRDAWHPNSFWDRVGVLATKYNLWVILVVFSLLFMPVAILYPQVKISYNFLEQLPQESESGQGFNILAEHFNVSEIFPSYVIFTYTENTPTSLILSHQYELIKQIQRLPGIAMVQSILTPDNSGEVNPIMRVSGQLAILASTLESGNQIEDSLMKLALLYGYLDELQNAFPQNNVNQTQALVLQAWFLAQNEEWAQLEMLMPQLTQSILNLAGVFTQNTDPFWISSVLMQANPAYATLINTFMTADGQAIYFYILVSDHPFSSSAMNTMREVRQVVNNFSVGTNFVTATAVGGSTTVQADIQDAMNRDVIVIQIVMVICLFFILAFLLRSLLAPIYLLATVLISYFTTMGLCSWIFVDWLGHDGIGFFMPIIVFVLLVALGSDYNMFLMSRVKEEAENHPNKVSVRRAVAMTGGIISACGLILGGTFAALTIAPILMLLQIGVAVAVGVFLDTFVIRPLLVPAITSLLGRYTWWPFGHQQVEHFPADSPESHPK